MKTLATLLFATLCACTGEVAYQGTATYDANPDLVTVSPGVQVVADYDAPVFYSDGFYWRFEDNGWYRSNNYSSGWAYVDAPPYAVARIHEPRAFVHYRPSGYVARHRTYRHPEVIREHHARR